MGNRWCSDASASARQGPLRRSKHLHPATFAARLFLFSRLALSHELQYEMLRIVGDRQLRS